jgi:DNA-binding XRE family transcriptional regulator
MLQLCITKQIKIHKWSNAMTDANERLQTNLLGELAQRRQALAISQAELATRIGVSRMTVQRAETEGADPQLSTFIAMANALGLRVHVRENDAEIIPEEQIIHRGYVHNRTKHDVDWKDRQRESAFAKSWEAVNEHKPVGLSAVMSQLVPQHTQAQASAAATVIQWLGSDIGFDFLQNALALAGYQVVEKQKKK